MSRFGSNRRDFLAAAGALGRSIRWSHAVAALFVALALQVGVNYANDYSDGVRGTDANRRGPLRRVCPIRLCAPRRIGTRRAERVHDDDALGLLVLAVIFTGVVTLPLKRFAIEGMTEFRRMGVAQRGALRRLQCLEGRARGVLALRRGRQAKEIGLFRVEPVARQPAHRHRPLAGWSATGSRNWSG